MCVTFLHVQHFQRNNSYPFGVSIFSEHFNYFHHFVASVGAASIQSNPTEGIFFPPSPTFLHLHPFLFMCVCVGGGGRGGQGSLLLNPQRFDVIMPAPPAPSVGILRHPQPIPARKSELSSYPAQLNQINQKEEEEEEGKGDGNRNQLLRGEHVAIDVQISSRGSCDMQMSLCSCCSVQECCALMKNNKRRPCPLFAGFPSSSPWSLLPPPSHSSSCQESWEDGAGMLCPEILTGDSGARLTPSEPRPMAADRPRERGPAAGLRPAAFTFYLISLGINLIDINHLNRAPRPPRPPHRPQQVMEATGRRRWARPSHSPPPTPDYSIADG